MMLKQVMETEVFLSLGDVNCAIKEYIEKHNKAGIPGPAKYDHVIKVQGVNTIAAYGGVKVIYRVPVDA